MIVLGIMAATPVQASGLKTHLWIAEEIIKDLAPDCAVTLDNRSIKIPEETCVAILTHRDHFRAGALGPDAYPDIITGQVTVHPGVEGDWQTSDWLQLLYTDASGGEELAFAAGYLIHAASDTFAHTYVNGYAGDIFDLQGERAVELRHFVLEKYIDGLLPEGQPDPRDIRAPDHFLAMNLILNPDAARVSARSGTALHIAAMYGVYTAVDNLAERLDDIENNAGNAIADLVALDLELSAKIADGEVALSSAEIALLGVETQLGVEKEAYDLAKSAADDALSALERNKGDILLSEFRANAARDAINTAHQTATDANNAISGLQISLIDLKRRIAGVPAEQCHRWTDNVCNSVCPRRLLRRLCREVCRAVERVSCVVPDGFSRLSNEIANVENEIAKAQRLADQAALDVGQYTAVESTSLQRKIELEGLTAGLEATRAATNATFELVNAQYEIRLAAVAEASEKVRKLREGLANFRKELFDTDALRDRIKEMVAQSNVLSFYARNWRNGIEVASDEYIRTGTKVAIGLTTGNGGIFSAYGEWLSCYGGAFTPVPYQVGQYACEAKSAWEELNAAIDQLILDILPEPFAGLYRQVLDFKSYAKGEVSTAVSNAGLELVKLAAPDESTREFIDLLAKPENATASRMNAIYQETGDARNKPLLTFEFVSDLIDEDLHIENDALDPELFGPLRNARSLSRLALLDRPTLDTLTFRLGGNVDPRPAERGRYSVLYTMLRSIDGNHQWQPYGLPYPRTSGPAQPESGDERHYGFGPEDGGGFWLFTDETNRRRVFPRLFILTASGALARRPELNGDYPFPECPQHLFPVAFDPMGRPASEDRTCDAPVQDAFFQPFGDNLVRFWRSIRIAFGWRPDVVTEETAPLGISAEDLAAKSSKKGSRYFKPEPPLFPAKDRFAAGTT